MSLRRWTVGSCLIAAALLMLASAPAMAQRGGGGAGGGGGSRGGGGNVGGGGGGRVDGGGGRVDGGGGRVDGGGWSGGYRQGTGQGQYGAWQRSDAGAGGRPYGYGSAYRPDRGGYYAGSRYGNDWRNYGYGYGHGGGWPRYGWWGGWGPRWGWSGYSYGWPGYYSGYGYDGDYYGADVGNYGPMYEEDEEEPDVSGELSQQSGDEGYLSEAMQAFENGDYRTALRMAGHAAVDDPRNPEVHLLATLALFATGDYRGAASQAHLLASLGHSPTWDQVYDLYGNARPYTRQIRALENYVKSHRSSAEARFLLGFLYMTGGYRDAAKKELQAANKLSPRDRIAVTLLKRVGGTPSTEVAARPDNKERESGYDHQRKQGESIKQPKTAGKPIENVQPPLGGPQPDVRQQGTRQPIEGADGQRERDQGAGPPQADDEASGEDSSQPSNVPARHHPKPQNDQ